MPTKPKRVAITLSPATYTIIAKLGSLQHKPMSRVVAELVDEIAPAMARVADLLEQVTKNRDNLPKDVIARLGALEDLMEHTSEFAMDRLNAAVTPKPAEPREAGRRRKRH